MSKRYACVSSELCEADRNVGIPNSASLRSIKKNWMSSEMFQRLWALMPVAN